MRRTSGRPRFVTAEGVFLNGAAPGSDKGLAGARGWEQVVGAGSLRRSTCANARGEEAEAGVGVERCVSGRPVVASRSASVSAAEKAPGSADGVCASDCGRASWSASESGNGCWSGSAVGGTAVNNGGGRWGENGAGVGVGGDDSHKTGGKLGSGSACSGRQCRSSLRCESEWPYSARRPQGSSRTQSWLGELAERRGGRLLGRDGRVYIRGLVGRANTKKIHYVPGTKLTQSLLSGGALHNRQ